MLRAFCLAGLAGACLLLQPTPVQAEGQSLEARWRARLGDRAACFVVRSLPGGHTLRSDAERCRRRLPPYSTFKIPHSLIGLDTGALAGADTVIPWDRERYPAEGWWPRAWRRNNDLRSAMAHSVVPYYRTLARRIGAAAMKRYLRGFGYGNQAAGPQLDAFWLGGDLAISPDEQVAFLARLHQGELPVSLRAARIVQDILVLERAPGYVLRGKTGTGPVGKGRYVGWLVGSVETCDQVHVFALVLDGPSMASLSRAGRRDMVRAMLADMGVRPTAAPCPRPARP